MGPEGDLWFKQVLAGQAAFLAGTRRRALPFDGTGGDRWYTGSTYLPDYRLFRRCHAGGR
ncbi:hypothetical protein GCM10011577_20430 [Pseudarthrobacter polychromogenes]|uniref:Uncharacterized protein n=1 Tax=Pseudarthrobacter polychromogenes TaxID=1676 RepID=A0ABQ1XLT4_9MICC|nr:hypothetical protein [Arthrobacter sp. S13_S34]GGG97070.1 hypothetical protein GCM10011577_20430 [Pseudarthrobacter polychromogenes]